MRIAARRQSERLLAGSSINEVGKFLQSRGRQQDVIQLGRGEPIVLLPGLAGGRALLTPLAQRLARNNLVVLPNLRGDRNVLGLDPARDVADHADDLALTLDNLGLGRPILMGVSYGGAVALEYAVTHPDRISGLATWGVEAKFRPTLGTTIAQRVCDRFPLPTDNHFLNQFFNLLHGGRPEPGPLVDFIVEKCWQTDQSVVAHRIAGLEDFDVSDRLWRIDVPTLIMGGSRDVVIPPSRQRAMAAAIAGASFVQVEGAGHIGFLTHREQVAEQLATLVHKVRRSYC